MENAQEKSVEEKLEEGKQRDEILYSFKGTGIAQIVIGSLLFVLGIVGVATSRWFAFCKIGSGIWCSPFCIASGVMSICASQNVTYFTAGWSMLTSTVASFFLFLHLCFEVIASITVIPYDPALIMLHVILFIIGLAEFTLCVYGAIVFGRLYTHYPYYSVGGIRDLCSCCCGSVGQPSFTNVMYSAVNPKRHNA